MAGEPRRTLICYTGGITRPRQPTNGTTQTIVGGDNSYPLTTFFAAGSTSPGASGGRAQNALMAALKTGFLGP